MAEPHEPWPVRRLLVPSDPALPRAFPLTTEWLVANGLGGYACGTVAGTPTRRYHGLLMAALPAPLGRTLVMGPLLDTVITPDGTRHDLARLDHSDEAAAQVAELVPLALREFRLEMGMPVWLYELGGMVLEKRVLMAHGLNAAVAAYRLLEGGPVKLELQLIVPFRDCHAPVNLNPSGPLEIRASGERWEIHGPPALPALRIAIHGAPAVLQLENRQFDGVRYREEVARGYDSVGTLAIPGVIHVELQRDRVVYLTASTEEWARLDPLPPELIQQSEAERRRRLLASAGVAAADAVGAELVLAADQFLIVPAGRAAEAERIRAEGDEPRSVIAGYHWFTDWGRDTMISLEGLTLTTGRHLEAGSILRTFAHHIRDGLIPNFFPDGANEGVYHTADATLWFFQALHRYLEVTGDRGTLRVLLPKLWDILEHHLRGTRFGIGVDPADGLLRQGQAGYQLTWMDAKVGDWVVTPRRGKAVEINALWYNALCLLRDWATGATGATGANGSHGADGAAAEPTSTAGRDLDPLIEQARTSFNRRFWNPRTGHLFDVVDGEGGDDPSCRPNQVFAIALSHPVLKREHWQPVLETVRDRLLTPVGLRTLAPDHPDYKAWYRGDLRARDGAYHQGAVWPWLIGPFLDAWLRAYPADQDRARGWLEGLLPHLSDCGIGTVGEIFDAAPPHLPRGCIAQAWSVAEMLRWWMRTRQ